jgi:soluble lytic murein transglycosylase-like protein
VTNENAYDSLIQQIAAQFAVPAALVKAVVWQESNFNPNATGTKGDSGLMQVMPDTARILGFQGSQSELYDPTVNITLGTRLLADNIRQARNHDIAIAISAYNAGFSRQRSGDAKRINDADPNAAFINQSYVDRIIAKANQYAAEWRNQPATLAPIITYANDQIQGGGIVSTVAIALFVGLLTHLLIGD